MLKKSLLTVLLSVATITCYADAATNMTVDKDMINQPFSIDAKNWGYQFNAAQGKILTFTLTVAKTSKGNIEFQCWHVPLPGPGDEYELKPGETSKPCITDDAIRVVADKDYNPASGTYTVTVKQK
jgi:hypothetical protein